MRQNSKTIILICVFGMMLKVALILFNINEFYDPEELSRGLIASELIRGAAYPIFNYQIDSYSGGSLVIGLMAVPFFALFGESLFVLKIVSAIFSLLAAMFVYLIVSRYIDKLAAYFAAALIFLSPYSYTRLSLVAWGDHPQMPALLAIAFFMLYELTFGRRKNPLFLALFGFICGFGLYFSYHFAVSLFLCVLFLLAWDRRFFFGWSLVRFISGFAIGFSPWIYFNLTHNFAGLIVNDYGSVIDILKFFDPSNIFKKFYQLITGGLGYSFGSGLTPASADRGISLLYYSIFIIAFIFLSFRHMRAVCSFFNALILLRKPQDSPRRNWQVVPFLLYVPVFILFAVFSPYRLKNWPDYFADRYLTSLHMCIFVIIGIFCAAMLREKGLKKVAAIAMTGIIFFTGVFTQAGIIFRGARSRSIGECYRQAAETDGFSYAFLMDDRVAYSWYRGGNLTKELSVIAACDDPLRRYYLSCALGRSVSYYAKAEFSAALRLLSQTKFPDEAVSRSVYEGLGYGRGRWYFDCLQADIALVKGSYFFEHFLKGLQKSVVYWPDSMSGSVKCIVESVPGPFQERFFYQLGTGIAQKNKGVLADCLVDIAKGVPARYLRVVYKGMASEVRKRRFGGIDDEKDIIETVAKYAYPEYRDYLVTALLADQAVLNKFIRDFEDEYKKTLKDIAMVKMPEPKLNIEQIRNDFLEAYGKYKNKYGKDKNKSIAAELKLAKVLLLSGKINEALTMFTSLAIDKDAGLRDKLYARYFTAKIQLLYLSDIKSAEPIFRKIVADCQENNSAETAWAALWSKLRLGEIQERRLAIDKARLYFEDVLHSENINQLKKVDQAFINAFIAEKYLRLGQPQQSLEIVNKNLKNCKEFNSVDYDWALDWLYWIKMRVANLYHAGGDAERAKQLYGEIMDDGFFDLPGRLKTVFFYNIFYNPKPFFVNEQESLRDFGVTIEILSKYLPGDDDVIYALEQCKLSINQKYEQPLRY